MIEKNNTNIDASLWNAYANSFFRFETKWNVLSYVVITAWNPYSNLRSKEDNCIINQKLEKRLKHVNYVPVTVGDRTFEWYEESFAAEISIDDAITLANEFQQNAIYFVSHDDIYLIACGDPINRHKVAKMSERLV
ncbi:MULTISPECIES: DUF3293 domain-containing protein [Vibrio]|jgi:hypothetical protein|uniref:DUF3293 domain-containing protein n=1 Tax=Vibrio TaxID=662 RepID=UPI000243B8E1|nr:DUF3293 domain-containing protein [Vibrio sp. EJY3]AEX20941.1 hypothetical protein VEJY3_02215 [Vibrio sp. EJY3]